MRKDYLAFFYLAFSIETGGSDPVVYRAAGGVPDHQQRLMGRVGFFCRIVTQISRVSVVWRAVRQVLAYQNSAHQSGLPGIALRAGDGALRIFWWHRMARGAFGIVRRADHARHHGSRSAHAAYLSAL